MLEFYYTNNNNYVIVLLYLLHKFNLNIYISFLKIRSEEFLQFMLLQQPKEF